MIDSQTLEKQKIQMGCFSKTGTVIQTRIKFRKFSQPTLEILVLFYTFHVFLHTNMPHESSLLYQTESVLSTDDRQRLQMRERGTNKQVSAVSLTYETVMWWTVIGQK